MPTAGAPGPAALVGNREESPKMLANFSVQRQPAQCLEPRYLSVITYQFLVMAEGPVFRRVDLCTGIDCNVDR